MTRITNVDQVLILLRSHLQKSERSRKTRRPVIGAGVQKSAVERVSQIATDGQASDEDIRRALIAGILLEEFGSGIMNDPRFDDLVTHVLGVVAQERDGSSLIDRALVQLSGIR